MIFLLKFLGPSIEKMITYIVEVFASILGSLVIKWTSVISLQENPICINMEVEDNTFMPFICPQVQATYVMIQTTHVIDGIV
jgi:hypothetical protein